jgi:hypothetical protein
MTVAGPDNAAYGTICSLPLSLISATVFSEAMWQKVAEVCHGVKSNSYRQKTIQISLDMRGLAKGANTRDS